MALDLRDRIAGRLKSLVAPPLERGNRRAAVLAIAASKGGVGKTTTAINLGLACAHAGVRTLLCDLDPQAHVAAALRAEAPPGMGSLSDVLLGRLRDVCEVAYPSRWAELDLSGSDKTLAETEIILSARIGKELILSGASEVARTRYDLVIIDCPPNLGTLTLNALCAADQLLVPCDMSLLAIEGVGDIMAAMETLRTRLGRTITLAGVLATRVDRRASQLNASVEQSLVDLHGPGLLETRIPQSTALNKAHLRGRPACESAPSSPGALAYQELAAELAPRLGLSLCPSNAKARAAATIP